MKIREKSDLLTLSIIPFSFANESAGLEILYFDEELVLDLIWNIVPVNLHERALNCPEQV